MSFADIALYARIWLGFDDSPYGVKVICLQKHSEIFDHISLRSSYVTKTNTKSV